jgi:cytochrome c2
MMKDKLFLKQMENVTKLGVLVVIAFVILTGIVLQEGLSNGFQEEDTSFYCGTTSDEGEFALKASYNKYNGDVQEGKSLFLEKCAACHNIDMVSDMTGPALYGAVDRWKNRADLYQWVQDYTVLVEQEHPRALLMEKWATSSMTEFTNLDTTEIRNIFAFVEIKANGSF